MKKIFLSVLTVLMAVAGSSQTQDDSPGSVTIRKCSDFTITGNGSSDVWSTTEWILLTPHEPGVTGYETKVKVLYSVKGIYFLYHCQDGKLTNTIHDDNMNLWEEDVVELFLWTSEDFPVYFEYEISPTDFELPIMVPNYKGRFLGWLPWNYAGDRRIIHATAVTGGPKEGGALVTGWTAEFFIPYKLLNPLPQVPPVSGTKWRANMYRIDYDNDPVHFSWQRTQRTFHEYTNFGTFIFE